jgi:hypothetical protein
MQQQKRSETVLNTLLYIMLALFVLVVIKVSSRAIYNYFNVPIPPDEFLTDALLNCTAFIVSGNCLIRAIFAKSINEDIYKFMNATVLANVLIVGLTIAFKGLPEASTPYRVILGIFPIVITYILK